MSVIIVCGGRDYKDLQTMENVLNTLNAVDPIERVINGGAHGADMLAVVWALKHDVPAPCYRADWKRYGKSAGPRRNALMLDKLLEYRNMSYSVYVVAFPGGKGTANMVEQAEQSLVQVIKIAGPTNDTAR